MASTGHAIVYVDSINGVWWIMEAYGPTVYRPFSYYPPDYQAIRRNDIEGDYVHDVFMDNNSARQRGGTVTYGCPYFSDWSKLSSGTGYRGSDYQYHAGTGSSSSPATVRYSPWLPQVGYYAVYISTPASSTFSNNVAVTVRDANGSTTYYVDETTGGGTWKQLGGFHYFNQGPLGNPVPNPASAAVIISTYGSVATKNVVADKVWFCLQN